MSGHRQEGVKLNLLGLPSIFNLVYPAYSKYALYDNRHQASTTENLGYLSKMTIYFLHQVLLHPQAPPAHASFPSSKLRLSMLLQGVSKDRPGCAVHYWEHDSLPIDSTIKVLLSY